MQKLKSLLRYPKLYKSYLAMAIKVRLNYRVDALVGIFSFIVTNAISFSTIYLTVSVIPSLEGWSIESLLFLYGFVLLPKSIDHIFTDAVWYVGSNYVVKGQLDMYLVKPLNPLFQIIAEIFQPEGFGELILGITLMCIFAPMQNVIWSASNIIPLIICAFFAIFVFLGVKLFTATLAIWMKRSIVIMSTLYNLSDFAFYPISIFGNVIKTILFYVIPFGLVIYLPIQYLLEGRSMWGLSLIVAAVSVGYFCLSYLFWSFGLKKYESAGS